MKSHMKIFWFITFRTKLRLVQKPLRIRFDKVNGIVRVYDGTRYLVLFGPEKHDAIFNRIRYLISQKGGITYIISHAYGRIKVDSYDHFSLEEIRTFHNVTILIKSILKKDKNSCHYNMFLEKGSNKNKSYTQFSFEINVCIKMLYYNRIYVSEGIDVIKTSE